MSSTAAAHQADAALAAPGEEEDSYLPIERLAEAGVNAGDIKKARDGGFYTIQSLQMHHSKNLKDIKGLSEARIEKMLDASYKFVNICGFKTAADVEIKRKTVIRVTTGSKELDSMLGGGIETGIITEAHGESKSGKTQLAHTLMVTSQLPIESGGGAGKVCVIDTENTFRPERIIPIAERFNLEPEDVMNNISHARCFTSEQQSNILAQAAALFCQDPYRVLIIDSLTSLWRVDYSGRGELAERQQKLNQHMSHLLKLAEEFNIAVLVTNQVTANPDSALAFAPKFKPIGGHIIAHACTVRLSLIKGRQDERICKIVDSPCLPDADCKILLTDGGFSDVKD